MCYKLLLSTDGDDDLSRNDSELLRFVRELPPMIEAQMLRYVNRWFVASRHGCSCGFRHLHTSATELGFDTPQDWYEEQAEDIEATRRFVAVVNGLLEHGHQADCIDVWDHETESSTVVEQRVVELHTLSPGAFRFMEARHFIFTGPSP